MHASESTKAPPDSGQLYTPEEAAELVRMTPHWLKRRARLGEIPCHRLGRTIRFSGEDLAEILRAAAQPAGQRA